MLDQLRDVSNSFFVHCILLKGVVRKGFLFETYIFISFTDRPLTDQPIFKKREIDLARQIIDKPDGSDLILLNKILNGATKVDNGGLALDLKNLKQIMNEMEIDSIPELEEILLEEKKLLMDYLRKTRNVNRPRNSMYVNDILQRLRRK